MKEIRKIAIFAQGDAAWQGGIQYITSIIYALDAIANERKLEVHLFKNPEQQFNDLLDFNSINLVVHEISKIFPPATFMNRLKWFIQRKFNGRRNPRYENYFIQQGFDYIYPATLSDCNKKLNAGSWIADFQYHNFPDGHSAEKTQEAEQTISFIAENMRKIVLSSKSCERDSHALFPVTIGKTHVMPFAVYFSETNLKFNDFKLVKNQYGIDEQFLMVSNLFAHVKNHKTLFEALGILRKQGLKIKLVCTGNLVNYAQMEFTNEILQIITRTGIRDQLFLLGLIPREHQVALYRMSMAIVQPSVHEGWSTCVEEAKALGKLLLLSDIEVHKEQYPSNPWFFSATDANDLADKIKQVYLLQFSKNFPELELEEKAVEQYRQVVKDFANNFLRIAAC